MWHVTGLKPDGRFCWHMHGACTFCWTVSEPLSPVCIFCLSVERLKKLDLLSGGVSCINGRGGCNKAAIKCTVKEETWWKKRMKSSLMCQNLSLSRFTSNVNCSSVWSLSLWNVWQFSSLRLAEALSIACDVQWHTVSQAHVCSRESLSFTDKHQAKWWYWLTIFRTFMETISRKVGVSCDLNLETDGHKWLDVMSFSLFHLSFKIYPLPFFTHYQKHKDSTKKLVKHKTAHLTMLKPC